MTDKSLGGLLGFLDWTADKGLMAKNTVNGRKAAVSGVLGVLDPEEKGDVTTLDLDSIMSRFIILQGKKYSPGSMSVYRSRTNASLNDFKRYLGDPIGFKAVPGKPDKITQQKNSKPHKLRRPSPPSETPSNPSVGPTSVQASANVLPIQIREDLIIRIHGLPFNLTALEAERIANVIKAMAMATA